MDAHCYDAEVLTRFDEIRSVVPDWEKLALRFESPLLGANWFLACAQTLCSESDLRIVVVRSKGVLCAVAPLVVARRDGVERLEVLGVSVLYEPTGFLYDGVESLRCLVSKIIALRMPMVLARIPVDSPIETTFRGLVRRRGVVLGRRTASAAYVNVNGSWEDYFQAISGPRRKRYRYQRKLAERSGQVIMRVARPRSREGLPVILEQVFRVEGAGWKGRSGSSLLSNERVRRFFTRYSEMACESGTLLVCFLEVNGSPIATILGIEYGQRLWVLKMGYDEQWAPCSPGIQLTMETIRYAFEQGLKGYEFLGSEEPWQAIWPRSRHELTSLLLYPMSVPGLLSLCGDLQCFLMKRAQQTLRHIAFWKRADVSA